MGSGVVSSTQCVIDSRDQRAQKFLEPFGQIFLDFPHLVSLPHPLYHQHTVQHYCSLKVVNEMSLKIAYQQVVGSNDGEIAQNTPLLYIERSSQNYQIFTPRKIALNIELNDLVKLNAVNRCK